MGRVLSLGAARDEKARAEAEKERIVIQNRFAIAMLHVSEKDKLLIYTLVEEYGIKTLCGVLELRQARNDH